MPFEPKISEIFSSSGLRVTNLTRGTSADYVVPTIVDGLITRKGLPFELIWNVGHVFAIPSPQYSEASFEQRGPEKLSISIGSHFVLTFVVETSWKLRELSYYELGH